MRSELEIEAILDRTLVPTELDRDLLAVALNERFAELGGDHRTLPYIDDCDANGSES